MSKRNYYQYWGKASRESSAYHLLPYHCLDVAAVGYQLLIQSPSLLQHLAKLTGMEKSQLIKWMTFFLVLHDLGKFSISFQNLRSDILLKLQQKESQKAYIKRHDTLGYFFWQRVLKQYLSDQGVLDIASGRRRSATEETFDFWMLAVTGHHGQPPENIDGIVLDDMFRKEDIDAAVGFVQDVMVLLLENNIAFPFHDVKQIQQASWWLSGFTVLCDWLGSSRHEDEYMSQLIDLADYWQQQLPWAEHLIKKNEIITATPVNNLPVKQLFGSHIQGNIEMTPLQNQAAAIPMKSQPQLFILEDVTGAGKTEAAMILLYRLMASGQSQGFYFGLPSMATANAMYQRMADIYQKLYTKEKPPSLVLAHSASKLNKQFRQSLRQIDCIEKADYGDGLEPASSHCSDWLSDNRKKALLADVGVGTIDQALLSILPSRHQSLRLLGLLGKVLLVDEVHACDAYMHTLLCGLLQAHAHAGGSAILLSATLPFEQRQNLVDAFVRGMQVAPKALQKKSLNDYPLITHVQADGVEEIGIATRSSVKRQLKVTVLEKESAIYEVIHQALQKGQCVCWVRNTVKDARQAWAGFKSAYPESSVHLFHARFAMGDRLEIEQQILKQFGPDSDKNSRSGQLLIATQVVEQSLDLDFDYLITDLAPVDLIIQRAGRLRRHQRDKQGNRIQGDDQRGEAELMIYSPPWQDPPESDWLKKTLPGTAAVYENQDAMLWQGLKLLRLSGGFSMPQDARKLIEGVYGEQADLPESLSESLLQQQAGNMAKTGQGRMNLLKLNLGYRKDVQNIWWDEVNTPTRLGEETTTVYLARLQQGKLLPWIEQEEYPWANSSLIVRKVFIASDAQHSEISSFEVGQVKKQLPAQGKYSVLLPMEQIKSDVWKGSAINEKGEDSIFYYHDCYGFMQAREYQELEDTD